jgi:hypothetical protein
MVRIRLSESSSAQQVVHKEMDTFFCTVRKSIKNFLQIYAVFIAQSLNNVANKSTICGEFVRDLLTKTPQACLFAIGA